MANSLYKLFDGRQQAYKDATVSILSHLKDKLSKTVAFLINLDRDIKWVEVERYGDVSNIAYAIGIVSWNKGDIINIDGALKKVLITGYNSPVRILATIDGIESKEPVELYKEIAELKSIEEILPPSDSYKLFNDPDFFGIINEEKFKTYANKIHNEKRTTHTNITGFDIDKLTTAQKTALLLYDETNTGKLN